MSVHVVSHRRDHADEYFPANSLRLRPHQSDVSDIFSPCMDMTQIFMMYGHDSDFFFHFLFVQCHIGNLKQQQQQQQKRQNYPRDTPHKTLPFVHSTVRTAGWRTVLHAEYDAHTDNKQDETKGRRQLVEARHLRGLPTRG